MSKVNFLLYFEKNKILISGINFGNFLQSPNIFMISIEITNHNRGVNDKFQNLLKS
jgi:hypothetical protein